MLAGAIDALESDDDDMDDAEKAAAPETIEEEAAEDDSEAAAMAAKMKALEAELAEKVEDGGWKRQDGGAGEARGEARAMEEELAEKILDLEEQAAAEALVPPPVTKKDSDCQAESDEAFDHRMAMNTIRGQMSVLTAKADGPRQGDGDHRGAGGGGEVGASRRRRPRTTPGTAAISMTRSR